MKLTISMATFDDYDGVYFTIQSLRLYHDCKDVEFLVLDNNPQSTHSVALQHFLKDIPQSKYIEVTDRKSSWVKYDAFKHANGDVLLGIDCHVLLYPGFLEALREYFEEPNNRLNMLSGPVVYNRLNAISSCMDPQWRGHDFGTWANRPEEKLDLPFEIPLQGMGCFAFHREAWKELPVTFTGFGAEEWYMAEFTRRHGGKVMCHPKMKWVHRFGWPKRTFPLKLADKIRNYYTGWLDLYKSIEHPRIIEMTAHWKTQITEERLNQIIEGL